MSIKLHLDRFEGPLSLLLFLIRKEEMDIFDINIHEITKQYLEFVKKINEFDLETAGDFIAMAATLIQIKSRMLLPQYNDGGEIDLEVDPRKQLVHQLLEYEKFKIASETLYKRPLINRDWWLRGKKVSFVPDGEDPIHIEGDPQYGIIKAYLMVSRRLKKAVHKVANKAQSIASRVAELGSFLIPGKRLLLDDLVDLPKPAEDRRFTLLISFLSMLELAKIGVVSLFQNIDDENLYVVAKSKIEEGVIDSIDGFTYSEDQTAPDFGSVEPEKSLLSEELAFITDNNEELNKLSDVPVENLEKTVIGESNV